MSTKAITKPILLERFPTQTDNLRLSSSSGSSIEDADSPNPDLLKNIVFPPTCNTYQQRLETFRTFPKKQPSAEKFAKAGFYYLGISDVVRCIVCNVEGHNWLVEDDPMEHHRTWNPNCPFVKSVSDNADSELNIDTCGKYGIDKEGMLNSAQVKSVDFEKLGCLKFKGPANPQYVTKESRMKTFENWPKTLPIKPPALVDAGFYYTGTGDQVLCFHCGGGLRDWEINDDPWVQHALWFSKCPYLIMKKGTDFIDEVNKLKDNLHIDTEELKPSTSENSSASSSQKIETKEVASDEEAKPSTSALTQLNNEEKKNDDDDEWKEKYLCKICYKNELLVVFLPCRHMVACADCAAALKTCAVCRGPLQYTLTVIQ